MASQDSLLVPRELFRRWQEDIRLQCRVSINQMWRGCLGLAAVVEDFDRHALAIGEHVFLPNEAITWGGLRDIPRGRCPGSPDVDRRGASYVSFAKASLAYGMPRIDLSQGGRDAYDLRMRPVQVDGHVHSLDIWGDRRKAAVAIMLSEQMTHAAYFGTDATGRSIRTPWRAHRPSRDACYAVAHPARWMPRPYVLVSHEDVMRLQRGSANQSSRGSFGVYFDINQMLVPVDISSRYRDLRPQALWWDVTPAAPHLCCPIEAFVFPAVRIRGWDALRFALPGAVELDATLGDPRFDLVRRVDRRSMKTRSAA